MNEKQLDEWIKKALEQEMTLPEGLSDRLEQRIDSWASEQPAKRTASLRRRLFGLSSAAAILLLAIGISLFTGVLPRKTVLADTYTDPKEAARVAQETLLFMSENLNKGIEQAKEAENEINNINEILNKHLNRP